MVSLAVLHEGRPQQLNTTFTYLLLAILGGALVLGGWMLWMSPRLQHRGLYMLTWLALGVFMQLMYRKFRAHWTGLKAKGTGVSMLRSLPDSYDVFANVQVKGRVLDAVAVGENGVFLVAMNGRSGTVTPSEGGWVQHKVGQGGTPYDAAMKDPRKALAFSARALAAFLGEHGLHPAIDGSVLFTSAELAEDAPRCYEDAGALCAHITSFRPPVTISGSERAQLVALLEKSLA